MLKHETSIAFYRMTFHILKREDGTYIAINAKYINEDGTLNKTLNDYQLYAEESCIDCIRSTVINELIDFHQSFGDTFDQAFDKATQFYEFVTLDQLEHNAMIDWNKIPE